MRTGNLSSVFKIILIVIIAIIVCVGSGLAISTADAGKTITNSGTTQIKNIAENNGDLTEAQYDGNTLIGSDVVHLIEESLENKDIMAIVVRTLGGSRTDYNYIYNETSNSIATGGTNSIQESKAQSNYINPGSLFLCSTKKDENGTIICYWFDQQ
jgi:hypothetical protein